MADIFVSYTSSDRDWAFWIGQELEKLEHTAHVHEWEISAGGDIAAWMEQRHQAADHVLCIISKAYLAASYSSWERRAAEWAAAKDRPNFVLPVFVEVCEPTTLLAPLKKCELHGLRENDARARLAAFLVPAAKPSTPVRYPGDGKPQASAATTRKAAAFPGERCALSNIPIAVPFHFLGRDEDLAAIETALARHDGRVPITALHGLRGVGKTTLAAAYAERHRRDYRATWWIRAQSEPTMRADLAAIGVRLGWVEPEEKEEPAVATVMEHLRDEGEGILLIFDNAIDATSLKSYLPRRGGCHVLVTSNAPTWRGIAAPVEIELWPQEVGAEYLIARTGRTDKRDAALALSDSLGGLPLAHEQAAAYCERLDISLADYRKRFEAAPARLLDDTRNAPAEYHDGLTVAKTFALAIDEAAKLHPAAEPLIVHAALLAPEPIPLFMFSDARDCFDEPFASAIEGDGLDEAVAALRHFALVERETIADEREPAIATDCIRLHRLVRQVAGARREGESKEGVRRALLTALNAVYPGGVFDDPAAWPRARRLDGPALALLREEALPPRMEKLASWLLDRLGSYRQGALAAYAQAQPLFERALALREKAFGPEHLDTAWSLNNLALLLQNQGDLKGARPLFERALAVVEKGLGPESPATATALNNLAALFRDQGELARARPLSERAVAIDEKALGPEHPQTAASLNTLALLLHDLDDIAGARSLYLRALAICEKALGTEHPLTNRVRGNLAALLLAAGEPREALTVGEAALAAHAKMLGANHSWTKRSAGVTADALDAVHRSTEAAALRAKYGVHAAHNRSIDQSAEEPGQADR
jgi:tetratricopeptide (TPR) repeat protein